MAGYDARTGKPLYGDARIVQSIRRLIVTRHSLILRRELACSLP
ncbi:GPW/gp25 family protein [Roseibium sp. TrichSKD4]|nr:GPW/gp25 family protein [Roseibium sp. TrichSKD4]